ncbi:glutathione S-transferase [Tropicimonas isoalkanivorans]|uniref:Glutathione S-transferase n=2 Tax=Tropicimonas isoalkanivorans TaxID=441112 RepID=A0A1I1JI41_9RHOB|nr:glutathione S-transferase [Tropicimonas isoalkanivorans]SFC46278.1 glutathione S-transferase [Tropicimonas isoalkanivorans]
MSYELLIGDPAYSSWSLRAWLLFDRFGLPVREIMVSFLQDSVAAQVAPHRPARTVPTMRTPDGTVVWDSLAIAEELCSRHPDLGLWPRDATARAIARSLSAEMHSGFATLRSECPMNLNRAYRNVPVSPELRNDLRRIEHMWDYAQTICLSEGPWLCGTYSIADAFYAPVAARIAGYGLSVSATARAYVAAHLRDPAFRRWRAMALSGGHILPWYERGYPRSNWPGPVPSPARALPDGPSVNAACPFTGRPVTEFAEIEGMIIGFSEISNRDKAVADPDVWPQVLALTKSKPQPSQH